MKKLLFIALLVVILAPFASAKGKGGGGGGSGGKTGTMNVQVREAVVKSTPNYLGASSGTISYGAQVSVIGEQGNWYQIASPPGWIPQSAVTKHKVAVDPEKKFAGKGSSRDEVALAGKGFNPQVEAQYKRDNAELAAAYANVDKIEGFGASEGELKSFQAAGKLTPR